MAGSITFGAWLKSYRRRQDLTQKELAYKAGCSVGTIRKIESDERRPSRQLAALLAEHLNIPLEQREAFIAFVRAEAYTADVSIPILTPADEQILAIPTTPHEAPPRTIKHNLPSETTVFLGREPELAALDDLFINLDRRLVTIIGPGGIGKTRLALAYAEQLVEEAPQLQYPNGVFFVNLAPLAESERMVVTLTETLGLRIQGGTREKRTPKQQLLDYLRDRRLLLLLDNFEHLLPPADSPDPSRQVGGASLVAEILQSATEVRILVTSRERLNLHMEQAFPLEGLEVPDWDSESTNGEIVNAITHSAVQLFLQAAQRSQPDYSLETRNELTALIHICHLVGGMPLALELAASWIDTLSLEDIADELKRGLDLLETELRDVPQRQLSIRATFDYSWRLLDESERAVFAQISIFRGGFTRPAVQAVTRATLQQLSRLVNKSFIQFNKKRDRYQIHALLRQYAADKLAWDSALETGLYDRHSSYYCQTLANHSGDLKSAGERQALYTVEADIENVRLAWNHAISRRDLRSIGSSLETLYAYYGKNEISAGIDEFEKAVTALQDNEISGERGVIIGRLLTCLGYWYDMIGQPVKAKKLLREGVELLGRLGAHEQTLEPLLFLAGAHVSSGAMVSLKESGRLLQECLILARELGDQWAIGQTLLGMGRNAQASGCYETAEQRFQEALKQFKHIGDRGSILWALDRLSDVAIDRGRYAEALSLAPETRSRSQEFLFPTMGLWSLGDAMFALDAYEEAEDLFQQGLTFAREAGLNMALPHGLFHLGRIAFHKGDHAYAAQHYQESLSGALEFDDLVLVAKNHDGLGLLYMARGARSPAREYFQASLQAAIPLQRPPILLANLASIAKLFVEEGSCEYAAMLAMLIINHPASQARIKEQAKNLLTELEAELSANDLAITRQRSRLSNLDAVAAQLLVDLKTP